MVKDDPDSERGNPLTPLYCLLFSISSNGLFYAQTHSQDSTYHGIGYTSCEVLSKKSNSSMGSSTGINPTN